MVLKVKHILWLFSVVLGLKINFNKSCLIGINIDNHWLLDYSHKICSNIQSLPCSYLRMPLGASPSRIFTWNLIIDCMRKKLVGWKSICLSMVGRLVLKKSSLVSIMLYYLSIFRAPKVVLRKLDSIMRQFLWEVR